MDIICGKIALITGGATGIGAAYVKRLFKSGMKGCAISDIDCEKGQELAAEMNCCYGKGKALFIEADVTDKCAFDCVFQATIKKFKGLDLVVNNAGILRDKTWEKMIDINVNSTVHGSLLGIKYMGKNNGNCGGTIVNTASILGLSGMAGCPCYTGTKHFVIGFSRSIGTKFWYNLTGIRFLTICPGVTMTPMIDDAEGWVFDGFPGLGKLVTQNLGSEKEQSVEDLAEGLVTMLNEGENGSIWVCRRKDPIFEVTIPRISEMKKDKGDGCGSRRSTC
ncbi:15-hydroxyprostaglandin dehydrogenase [NAD(+)]-like [Anthonomus grandis grandis]|uniref:15-hydroxyprostaglandin dehydrogenase [NAD(+)]-like n=1 Tax=Anthonomus grandis grandis TaxID=2921223 RepID=UPI0021657D06|nr:15-hydroxyprostaglandin dehydrogenase [NAD(+)]-like [Anthonomus grandis grandis]